jgi:hypothetical protein
MLIKLFRAASLICSGYPHQPFPLHVQVSIFLFLCGINKREWGVVKSWYVEIAKWLVSFVPGSTTDCTAKNQHRKFETNIPRKELRGHSPNFHIHASVSDLYIPTIDLPTLLQEICGPILGIYKSLIDT